MWFIFNASYWHIILTGIYIYTYNRVAVSYIANVYRCIYQCIIINNNNTIRIILEWFRINVNYNFKYSYTIVKLVEFLND